MAGGSALLTVARIRRAHGIRGEVMLELLTDHPDVVLAPGCTLLLDAAVAGEAPEVVVESVRPHKGGLLARLRGVDSRSAAETLQGRELRVRLDEVAPLEADEVFYHDLVGLDVVLVDGTVVGPIRRVYESRPADLLEVRSGDRVILVPYDRRIVKDVDLESGRVVIDPPEGLLEL